MILKAPGLYWTFPLLDTVYISVLHESIGVALYLTFVPRSFCTFSMTQKIVSESLVFSIWGLTLVPLERASSLNLTEIAILKIVPKSASNVFSLLKEIYVMGKDFHCQVYRGMHLLGERNQCCGSNRWGKNHRWLGIGHLMEPGLPFHITSADCFN